MTPKYGPLGMRGEDRYRSSPEPDIFRAVLLAGWAYDIGSPLAVESTHKSMETWIKLGLPYRMSPSGVRLFDPIEVSSFVKRVGFDGIDTFLPERMLPTHQQMVTDLAEFGTSQGRPNKDARFVVRLARTFNLRAIAAGTKLRLRIPMPLPGSYLKNIQITPFTEAASKTEFKLSPGRLEVRMVASGEDEVTMGATLDVVVGLQEPHPGKVEGEVDRELYLAHTEGLVFVSDRVREFSYTLAKADAPVLEILRAFWEYINDQMMFGSIHYDQMDYANPSEWTLDAGWFDCQTAAALFVSLCRARGIPARVIGGYLLYRVAPMKHYWAEVWLEDQGWTPFDFISWDLSLGGRDKKWRDHYFGKIDYRLVCERMPREFTGALGVPLPEAWCMLQSAKDGGVENNFMDFNAVPVYSDTVQVLDLPGDGR